MEASADHRAAFAALHRRLAKVRRDDLLWDVCSQLSILSYEVNHPQRADVLVDITEQKPVLEEAMEVMRAAEERELAGHEVLHLEVGQPSTPAPAGALHAAADALQTDRLGYTGAAGIPALRDRIARWYDERYGVAVPAERQLAAIEALAGQLTPGMLALPEPVLAALPPRPPGYGDDRERFERQTGSTFDPMAPAAALVDLVLQVALHPQRAARMNAQHARDADLPSFRLVLAAVFLEPWMATDPTDDMAGALQRQAQSQALTGVMTLAAQAGVHAQVRAQAGAALAELEDWLDKRTRRPLVDPEWAAHQAMALEQLRAWRENADAWVPSESPSAPPGSPIGSGVSWNR